MSSQEPARIEPPRSRRDAWIETGFVLLVVVAPLTFRSMAAFVRGTGRRAGFDFQASYRTLESVCTIAVVLFVIWRSGERWRRFGLARFRPFRDPLLGLGIFLMAYVAYALTWWGANAILHWSEATRLAHPNLTALSMPRGLSGLLFLLVLSLTNAASEELVMRAFLITRFEQLFASTVLAVILSTILFVSYHTYQGPGGMVGVAAIGLVYGIMFCKCRRLWPLVLAHALQDFISLAMLAARR